MTRSKRDLSPVSKRIKRNIMDPHDIDVSFSFTKLLFESKVKVLELDFVDTLILKINAHFDKTNEKFNNLLLGLFSITTTIIDDEFINVHLSLPAKTRILVNCSQLFNALGFEDIIIPIEGNYFGISNDQVFSETFTGKKILLAALTGLYVSYQSSMGIPPSNFILPPLELIFKFECLNKSQTFKWVQKLDDTSCEEATMNQTMGFITLIINRCFENNPNFVINKKAYDTWPQFFKDSFVLWMLPSTSKNFEMSIKLGDALKTFYKIHNIETIFNTSQRFIISGALSRICKPKVIKPIESVVQEQQPEHVAPDRVPTPLQQPVAKPQQPEPVAPDRVPTPPQQPVVDPKKPEGVAPVKVPTLPQQPLQQPVEKPQQPEPVAPDKVPTPPQQPVVDPDKPEPVVPYRVPTPPQQPLQQPVAPVRTPSPQLPNDDNDDEPFEPLREVETPPPLEPDNDDPFEPLREVETPPLPDDGPVEPLREVHTPPLPEPLFDEIEIDNPIPRPQNLFFEFDPHFNPNLLAPRPNLQEFPSSSCLIVKEGSLNSDYIPSFGLCTIAGFIASKTFRKTNPFTVNWTSIDNLTFQMIDLHQKIFSPRTNHYVSFFLKLTN